MVLSQPSIRKAVKEKRIVFDPALEDDQWGEALFRPIRELE
jgi:hypothetical protein